MKDLVDTRDADTAQEDSPAWIRRMQQTGADCGYFEPLGDQHAALFNDAAPTLLVTFETEREIRAGQPDELPLGYRVAHANGWSSLTLIASAPGPNFSGLSVLRPPDRSRILRELSTCRVLVDKVSMCYFAPAPMPSRRPAPRCWR